MEENNTLEQSLNRQTDEQAQLSGNDQNSRNSQSKVHFREDSVLNKNQSSRLRYSRMGSYTQRNLRQSSRRSGMPEEAPLSYSKAPPNQYCENFEENDENENKVLNEISEILESRQTQEFVASYRQRMAQGFTGTSWQNHLRDIFHLSIASFIGVLCRGGLAWLFSKEWNVTNPWGPTFTDIASNFLGSFFMGIFVPSKPLVMAYSSSISLGLSTGFFGSLTTWSAWNLQAIKLFSVGYVASAFWCLIIGYCIAAGGYIMGEQIYELLLKPPEIPRDDFTGDERFSLSVKLRKRVNQVNHKTTIIVTGVLTFLFYAIAIILCVIYDNKLQSGTEPLWISIRHYSYACILSPFGTVLRWQLGVRVNPTIKLFPLGTFISNVLATFIAVALSAANISQEPHTVTLFNWVYSSIILGFCGCLSTVSTWIAEQFAAKTVVDKYVYSLFSFGICQAMGIAIYLPVLDHFCEKPYTDCQLIKPTGMEFF